MNQYFDIKGGNKLEGEVNTSGSKNAGFPVLAGLVLLNKPITLTNVPDIEDFRDFISILKKLGAKIEKGKNNSYFIDPTTINSSSVDETLGNKIRGSYYLLGSLISKFGKASIPQPGGCNIGNRPMDLHLESLKQFGVNFSFEGEILTAKLSDKSNSKVEIVLPFPSRGATINSILTASLLENVETIIRNSDQSPEATNLIEFLRLAGLEIQRKGKDIAIKGVKELRLENHSIAPDKIEVGTLLVGGLITNGEVKVKNIKRNDLKQLEFILSQIGAKYVINDEYISVLPNQLNTLKSAFLISGLYSPCIDADYEPVFTPLLCKVNGNSIIDDTINAERHSRFIYKLNEMGASIIEISPTRAVIEGKRNCEFKPNKNLVASDIRGGVAQLIAALTAQGESRIGNIVQIDRGYEFIEKKFQQLGGNIERINL